jgi:hypothetical protein
MWNGVDAIPLHDYHGAGVRSAGGIWTTGGGRRRSLKGVIVPDAVRLTATAYKKVGADAGKAEMLTQKEVEAIATKLNKVINLPILKEDREQIIFVKIVKQIDRFLYGVLPNELYELIRVASDGISEKDALIIEENLAKLANDYINLPFLTEPMEETVFRVVIGLIVRAMLKGESIKG